jgi:RimJ/RimL family protein N-acetyltransferase
VLTPDYPIHTPRLTLRPLGPDDVDAMYAYKSRADVCRYIPHPPLTYEQVGQRMAGTHTRSTLDDEGQALFLGVTLRESTVLIGDLVLFWHSREHRAGEIGYVLAPEHTGHGYATEALRELLRLGFDPQRGLGLHRITARLDARNTASARVAERLGLRREAHLVQNEWFKGEWTDELVYALLEDEWSSGQGLAQVGEQVLGVLDPDREPDQARGYLER